MKFTNIFLAFLLAAPLVFMGCGDDSDSTPNTGNLQITFKGTYGDEPLVMFESYDYADGQRIQFTTSDFYLSNFILFDGTEEVELVDVAFVDLSYSDAGSAQQGFSILIRDLPTKTYDAMQFAIGLDSLQNSGRPEDYSGNDPLGLPRYWEGWTSYIFAKTEGNLDSLGAGPFDLGWLYHTGTNDLYRRLGAAQSVRISKGETTRITFSLDHREIFGVGTDPIDIKGNPINHNPKDSVQVQTIVDNYSNAITYILE